MSPFIPNTFIIDNSHQLLVEKLFKDRSRVLFHKHLHKNSFTDLLTLTSMGCSLFVQLVGILTKMTRLQEVELYFPG